MRYDEQECGQVREKHIEVDASKWATLPLDSKILSNIQSIDKWISVKDRLPREYGSVLVWYEWYNRESDAECQWYGISLYDYGKWETENLESDCVNVLYWMPLPDAPND